MTVSFESEQICFFLRNNEYIYNKVNKRKKASDANNALRKMTREDSVCERAHHYTPYVNDI